MIFERKEKSSSLILKTFNYKIAANLTVVFLFFFSLSFFFTIQQILRWAPPSLMPNSGLITKRFMHKTMLLWRAVVVGVSNISYYDTDETFTAGNVTANRTK